MPDLRSLAKGRTRELIIRSESALRTLRETRSASDLPLYGGQELFADFLENIFVAARHRLETEALDIDQDAEQDLPNHLRNLGYISFLLNLLVSAIGSIGVAPNLLVSSALAPHLSRLGTAHLGTIAHVVVSPSWQINYFSRDLSEQLALLSPLLNDIKPGSVEAFKQFCLLGIPASEAENVLLHSVLYHELGHKVDASVAISAGISDEVKPLVAEYVPVGADDQDVFKFVMSNWSAELVADALAAAWVGPSSLVALRCLQGSSIEPDVLLDSHPTDRARLRVMKEVMTHAGSWPSFVKYLPREAEIVDWLLAKPKNIEFGAGCPDYLKPGLIAAEKALDVVVEHVAGKVWEYSMPTRASWTPADNQAIEHCLRMFRSLIVPLRRDTRPSSGLLEPHLLLLAGWSHLLTDRLNHTLAGDHTDEFEPEAELRLRIRHSRIVEKAIQDVELVSAWSQSVALAEIVGDKA